MAYNNIYAKVKFLNAIYLTYISGHIILSRQSCCNNTNIINTHNLYLMYFFTMNMLLKISSNNGCWAAVSVRVIKCYLNCVYLLLRSENFETPDAPWGF